MQVCIRSAVTSVIRLAIGCLPRLSRRGPIAGCARTQAQSVRRRSSSGRSPTFSAGRLAESVAGFDTLARIDPGRRAAALAARDRALLRRPLQGLPAAVRIAPHGEPERRRECRLAFPLRRPRRISPGRPGGLVAGRPGSAHADAAGLRHVSRHAETRRSAGGGRRPPRSRSSTRTSTSGCTPKRSATRTRALEHIKAAADDRFAMGGYMHTVAKLHLNILQRQRQ